MPITIACPGCKSTLRIRDEYAGQAMKCPRCSASVTVPPEEEVVAALAEEPEPAEAENAVQEVRPLPRVSKKIKMMACPECGQSIPADAHRCRHCGSSFDEEPEESDEPDYLPCPQCGKRRPDKVKWTWWGSYLGPKLCYQVRCRKCDHTYNGMTGGTNLVPKIIFVTVPLLAIIAIIVLLIIVLINR